MIIRKIETKIKDDKTLKSKISPSQAGMKGKGINNLSEIPDPSPSPRPSPLKGEGVFLTLYESIKNDEDVKSEISPSQAGMKGKGVNGLSGFPDPSPSPLPCGVLKLTPQGKPSPLKGEGVFLLMFLFLLEDGSQGGGGGGLQGLEDASQ